jgi:hypothetical protein
MLLILLRFSVALWDPRFISVLNIFLLLAVQILGTCPVRHAMRQCVRSVR